MFNFKSRNAAAESLKLVARLDFCIYVFRRQPSRSSGPGQFRGRPTSGLSAYKVHRRKGWSALALKVAIALRKVPRFAHHVSESIPLPLHHARPLIPQYYTRCNKAAWNARVYFRPLLVTLYIRRGIHPDILPGVSPLSALLLSTIRPFSSLTAAISSIITYTRTYVQLPR